jgi:hypothetical protein
MLLAETDRAVTKRVSQFNLLSQLGQHALVKLGPHARHPGLDLCAAANAE